MTEEIDGGVTRKLAAFVAGTRVGELPADVLHEARRLTLDVIGNILGGTRSHLGELALRYVEACDTRGAVGVIGTDIRTSAPLASYAHARLGDALDASDTFMSVQHLGPCVVAAAWSLAVASNASGATFLAAVAAGMEIGARIGAAEGPSLRAKAPRDGLPPNISTHHLPVEELAACAAAARVMGLDAAQIVHALGICGANAARHATHWGVSEILPDQKYQDYGVIVECGVTAALRAQAGLTTHPDALGGASGLWRLCGAAHCDFELMLAGLGTRWLSLSTTYKPWPSCRWTHYALTAFETLRDEYGLSDDAIDKVIVDSHVFGVAPYFRNQAPQGMVSCEFNYPHALAMSALRVPPGPLWYSAATLADPRVEAFRHRVEVRPEPYTETTRASIVDGQLRELPTRVTIVAGGRELVAETDFARGDPITERTRFTDEELFAKFLRMGSVPGADESAWLTHALHIRDAVRDLERQPNVRPLAALLTRKAVAGS